jgi:indolepyruvate ferredoxin oxidoreductase
VFRVLKRFRFLRGTAFDPFGYSAERRAERSLITEYEALIEEIIPALRPGNHWLAVQLASLPAEIRGYGPVKAAAMAKVGARRDELLQKFRIAAEAAPARESVVQ